VTCNAICPGYVLTDLVRNQLEDTSRARGIPVVRGPRPAAPFSTPALRRPCSHARSEGAPPRTQGKGRSRARARVTSHGGPSGCRMRPGATRPCELQAVAERAQAQCAACRSLARLVGRSPGGPRRIRTGCSPLTGARPPRARRAGQGDLGRAAGGPADQALCSRGGDCGARASPVQRRRRVHHRRLPLHRRRLDRAVAPGIRIRTGLANPVVANPAVS